MATRTVPQSERATEAALLVQSLQAFFVEQLQGLSLTLGSPCSFEPTEWLRDEGSHGGGVRYGVQDTPVFGRASINFSAIHYDDLPEKALGSATALSCIVHPRSPHAPSMHMHISWTELRTGRGYWRVMADLNPAIPDDGHRSAFDASVGAALGEMARAAREQGERYFYIPALERHRGVSHFYLENHSSGDFEADRALAGATARAAIGAYIQAVGDGHGRDASDEDRERQLAYHTSYLFQVLTLDRGTSSGLLIHDQNDVGIMGSLPGHVDPERLASWRPRMPAPQEELLDALLAALPKASPAPVTTAVKRALAQAVRSHYAKHPDALALQASGDVLPPTVDNHK